jgi:uncharacterized protein (TIGR03032 family)
MRRHYTDEVRNLALASAPEAAAEPRLDWRTEGPFWELLAELDLALAVSREYEHFVVLVGGDQGRPWQSALELPHPSGLFVAPESGELILSSTRTPNQLFWLRPLGPADWQREILPAGMEPPDGTVFLPYRSLLLPGSLYIHDLVLIDGEVFVTATGHNFLARIGRQGGWERVWWPGCVDGLGRAAFDQNYLQLNSIAVGTGPADSYYTAFSDQTGGAKPWKSGYGPRGRGVVFGGADRGVLLRGLTCPHSAKQRPDGLWLCNSGYGELGRVEDLAGQPRWQPVCTLPGFTRGLAFQGGYAFVGLSRVIDFYEPYAPGLVPAESRCGVVAVALATGRPVAALYWPEGYQIYDVQPLPGVRRPTLPHKPRGGEEINMLLRYLG